MPHVSWAEIRRRRKHETQQWRRARLKTVSRILKQAGCDHLLLPNAARLDTTERTYTIWATNANVRMEGEPRDTASGGVLVRSRTDLAAELEPALVAEAAAVHVTLTERVCAEIAGIANLGMFMNWVTSWWASRDDEPDWLGHNASWIDTTGFVTVNMTVPGSSPAGGTELTMSVPVVEADRKLLPGLRSTHSCGIELLDIYSELVSEHVLPDPCKD